MFAMRKLGFLAIDLSTMLLNGFKILLMYLDYRNIINTRKRATSLL